MSVDCSSTYPLCAGKTTLLRDITQVLADTLHQLLIVVDTSQEIAGGGDIPHSCIGSARRMAGAASQSKHAVLQEAVTNHGPEVNPATPQLAATQEHSCEVFYSCHG